MTRRYSKYVTVSADVDIDLSEICDEDIAEEYEERGLFKDRTEINGFEEDLLKVFEAKKYGLGDFDSLVSELFYKWLGKSL